MRLAVLDTGLTLSCLDNGAASDLAVVFLPGPTDSAFSYQPVLEHMPASLRCVAVSQRGHGDSDKPANGYAVEHFAGDVPRLLDALDIGRAVLVGHSGSCLTVRRVALDHPELVAGLALEAAPTTLKDDPGLLDFVESVVGSLDDPIDPEVARSFLTDTSAAGLDADLCQQLVAELVKVPVHVWNEMFAALLHYDDLAEIGAITAPTLLLWGDADQLVGRMMQDELLRRLPDATLAVYSGLGHTPRWEDPSRFASDVADFAQRLRGRRVVGT